MTNQPTLVSLSRRFAILMRGLRGAFIGRGNQTGLPRPLLDAIARRLNGMIARFDHLLARGPQTPSAKPPQSRRPRPERPYAPDPVPRHHAWLLRLVPATETEANICVTHRHAITQFLADPAMRAAIDQNPALHPLLRALCRMLGIPRPAHLPAPAAKPTPAQTLTPALSQSRKPRRNHPPRPSPFPTTPPKPTPWDQRQAFHALFGPPRLQYF